MSVPFSNTHLRVPRGFGAILEGLAREVLRDQPEDIPTYAAQYFSALLKQREDSGMDPAEWAANLEDRFYNNHAFKATEVSPETEPAAEVNTSKEKSDESQTEDESSHSTEASNVSKTQPNISEEADLTGSTGEEEEKHDNSEERIILMEKGLSEEESVNRPPAADATADVHPDGVRGTEEEKDPTTTIFDQGDRAASETDSSSVPNQDKPQPDLSLRGISNVDVCAQELETAEDEEGDKHENTGVDKEIVDSEGEEKTEVEEPVEVLPYSGLADVDVCATELAGTEGTVEGATVEDDTHDIEEESLKLQPEEAVEKSSLSQSEIPEDDQQAADDQVEKTKEKEGAETETSSGGMHGSLTHFEGGSDSNVIPKEDSLVEISFEDVPEAQQIKEDGEKPPEEKDSVEEMQQEEESEEVITEPTDQNISGTQDHNEPEMVGVEKEVNSEGEEMESQHEPSDIMNEKVDTGDSNVIASEDDEKGEGVKITSSSHQPTSEADEQNPENETDHKNEEEEKISEGRFQQNESNDPDFKVDETTDTAGGDKEDTEGHSEVVEDQEINDGSAEGHSSQITQSNISTAAMEDTVVEKEVTSKERTSEAEGPVEEGKIDSEIQEKSDEVCEEDRISLSQSADQQAAEHQGEERSHGSEKDATEPAGKSGDKQEDCSRPQEEEDIMDIPLDDPEANRAAAKIQAGFRGHMTRKKMKPEDKAEGEERQEDRGQ